MLRPRALGRRVAQRPQLFSGILRQFQEKKEHIKQSRSLSGLHVIVICFRLLRRIQAPFQATSGKIRQFQAESGNFRRFQAYSGRIRQKIWQIGQPIGSGRSLVRDPMVFQEAQVDALFCAELFWVHSIKRKPKQTTIKPQAMASFFPGYGNFADKS